MLRGMVPALSGRRGGLLFRHAGRVELEGGVDSGPAHERVKTKKNGAGMHREAKKNQIRKKHMQEADLSKKRHASGNLVFFPDFLFVKNFSYRSTKCRAVSNIYVGSMYLYNSVKANTGEEACVPSAASE